MIAFRIKVNSDIVNIALHISLKNFEQQCNEINIHSAMLHGYLFHCGVRRFALLIRVISAALLCRRHSAYRRAYPLVIPIAHVAAPYAFAHCRMYRYIRPHAVSPSFLPPVLRVSRVYCDFSDIREIPDVSLSALCSRMKSCLLRIHRRF